MQTQQNQAVNQSSNVGYIDSSILELRLSTDKLLESIELFLRGEKLVSSIEDNSPVVKAVKFGEALLNDHGVQALMSYLSLVFAPHAVQGNFTDLDYRNFIQELDNNLSCNIMENLDSWDVNIAHYNHIVDGIISAAEMFVSRLKDNKERESYNATLRSVENTVQQSKRGLLGG